MKKYNFCIDLDIESYSEEEAKTIAQNIVKIANERMAPFVTCNLSNDVSGQSEEELMELALEIWSNLQLQDNKNLN